MEKIYKNYFNRKDLIEYSKEYKYIIKANDKFFGSWDINDYKKHTQIILAKDATEKDIIIQDLEKDHTFNYINWYPLTESFFTNILALRKKDITYSIRNDWTRYKNV